MSPDAPLRPTFRFPVPRQIPLRAYPPILLRLPPSGNGIESEPLVARPRAVPPPAPFDTTAPQAQTDDLNQALEFYGVSVSSPRPATAPQAA